MHALLEPELWAALFTLAALEIVLGIDNIIFLSIMANTLPEAQRRRARVIGLAGACIARILLLLSLAWLATVTAPLFHPGDWGVAGRGILLIGGGLLRLGTRVAVIQDTVGGAGDPAEAQRKA